VNGRSAQIAERLSAIRSPYLFETRIKGLSIALEFCDPQTGTVGARFARLVRQAAFDRGLLCELGGREDATLRLLPPLIITPSQADEATSIIRTAVEAATRSVQYQA
jgi:diaminobutyrate-2-oxoglutarate transaminase